MSITSPKKKMSKSTKKAAKRAAPAQQSTTFDPNKNYQWTPQDNFTLSGVQFDLIYKTLREAALNPVGPNAQAKAMSYDIVHSLFIKGVEDGIIKEVAATPAPNAQ